MTRPTPQEMEQLVAVAYDTYDRMAESRICLSIFTPNYERDPVAMMQFAAAVLLDKPIYLVAPKGRVISGNVRALAAGIEFYEDGDLESLKAATKRLLEKATKGM